MTTITDQPKGHKATSEEEKASFLLTNGLGDYTLFSSTPKSRYEGVFFRDGNQLFKAINHIALRDPVSKLTNNLWSVERQRGSIIESFCMPYGQHALLYDLSEPAEIDVYLDCKEINDNREWGRTYEFTTEQECAVIHFSKKNDPREENKGEYDMYLAIHGDSIDALHVDRWKPEDYSYDQERNSPPGARWIYHGVKLRASSVAFGFSKDKQKAIDTAKKVFAYRDDIKKQEEERASEFDHKEMMTGDTDVGYLCSQFALEQLIVQLPGKEANLYAGLPWFFQFWARDSAISAKGLAMIGHQETAKKILLSLLDDITPQGIPTKDVNAHLNAADAPGWIFLRLFDFHHAGLLTEEETKQVAHAVTAYLEGIQLQDGLVVNNPLETWMDTNPGNDPRDGARIEINALVLGACRLYHSVTGSAHKMEKPLAQKVKEVFWNGAYLNDGADDDTIRPNVFIAAYAYRDLLTNDEWVMCFKKIVPSLWLEWGGFATIDKKNSLFIDTYTGEDNRSYHRGDSWFWLNNLAAIVLYRTDRAAFQEHIGKIIKASTHELLYLGVTGFAAEVSDAKELSSKGCWAQAWSNALYIELVNELFS